MSRRWAGRVVVAVAAWGGFLLVATLLGMTVRPLLFAGVVLAVACVVWLVLDASTAARPSYWTQESLDPVRSPGEDPRLDTLLRHLAKNFDAMEFADVLHADLTAVADERLIARHGLSRVADPDRAAVVLGADLSRFLSMTKDQRRPLTVAQLDHLLTRIEAL